MGPLDCFSIEFGGCNGGAHASNMFLNLVLLVPLTGDGALHPSLLPTDGIPYPFGLGGLPRKEGVVTASEVSELLIEGGTCM